MQSHSFLNVAMLQMTSTGDVQHNLQIASDLMVEAASKGAELVVLPEMFAQFGAGSPIDLAQSEADFNGPVAQTLKTLAKTYQLYVVAGTLPQLVSSDGRPHARSVVIDPNGDVITHYDKVHLFDAVIGDAQNRYQESDQYAPGDQLSFFDLPWGRIGLAVCYDLRFPELFRALNEAGADAVIVPSAFTYKTGQAHWEVLCRARAIENGFYIVAVNQCGKHDEHRQTWGHSMTISPWGLVEGLSDESPAIKLCRLDKSAIKDARSALPVNQHRRLPLP